MSIRLPLFFSCDDQLVEQDVISGRVTVHALMCCKQPAAYLILTNVIITRRHSRQLDASVCLLVCLFVRALTGKRLELSTPNLVHVYSIAVARHALTQRSKG